MNAHTPGPWQWEVTQGGDIRLATPDRGKLYVMGFARKGMRGAQPRFSLWGEGPRDRRGGIMHDFVEAGGETHPDARLIAAAPELLETAQTIRAAIDEGMQIDAETLNGLLLSRLDNAIAKATGTAVPQRELTMAEQAEQANIRG